MTPAAIANAATLIRHFEGCRYAPYADPIGHMTIGWGCRWLADGSPVTADTKPLTQAQADELLAVYLAPLAADVGEMLPADATDGEAAALLDFAWNLGPGALHRSTLLKLFRAGDRAGAAAQFAAWVYADGQKLPGLVARRAAERELFVGGITPAVHDSSGCVFHDLAIPCRTPGCSVCESADALNAAELRRIEAQ